MEGREREEGIPQKGVLAVILIVWEVPGSHFDCLGSSWESFCLSGLLGMILAFWEAPGSNFGCLGTS